MKRICGLLVATAALLVVPMGCGGDSEGLTAALDEVKSTKGTRAYFEYGDYKGLRAAIDGRDIWRQREVLTLSGAGGGRLVSYSHSGVDKELGFDVRKADRAVLAGQPPETVSILDGSWDTARIGAAFEKLKRKRQKADDGDLWVYSEKPTLDFEGDPLARKFANGFNMLYASEDRVAYSGSKPGLDLVLDDESQTLADSEPHQAIAGCLGDDVSAAIILRSGTGDDAPMIGVGARVAGRTDITEIACLRPASKQGLEQFGDRVRKTVTSGSTPRGTPWKTILGRPQVEVDTDNGVVKVTGIPPSKPMVAGRLFKAVQTRDLETLLR